MGCILDWHLEAVHLACALVEYGCKSLVTDKVYLLKLQTLLEVKVNSWYVYLDWSQAPTLSETEFTANWIQGLALRQETFIEVTCIDVFCRGAAPMDGQLEKSLKCSGNDWPWRWKNKAFEWKVYCSWYWKLYMVSKQCLHLYGILTMLEPVFGDMTIFGIHVQFLNTHQQKGEEKDILRKWQSPTECRSEN